MKSLKKDYKEIFLFLRKIKYYFLFSLLLFLFSSVMGYYFIPEEFSEQLIKNIKEEFSSFSSYTPFYLFLFIFFNNYIKATISSLSSFLLAIPSFILLVANGAILGMFFPKETITTSSGQVLGKVDFFKAILPHGILELTAIFIASAISFYFLIEFFKSYKKEESFHFKKRFWFLMKFNLLFLMPLFLLAAFVESYITPIIINL